MKEVLLSLAVLVALVAVVYLLERRIGRKGPLFTGPATPGMRALALLLGIVFANLFVLGLYASSFEIFWAILALALIAYAAGSGRMLRKIQGNGDSSPPKGTAKRVQPGAGVVCFRLVWKRALRAVGLLAAALVLCVVGVGGLFFVHAHLDNELVMAILVAGAILLGVSYVKGWLELGQLIKRILG